MRRVFVERIQNILMIGNSFCRRYLRELFGMAGAYGADYTQP